MLSLRNLKTIAFHNINKKIDNLEALKEYLIKWRSRKYNLLPTDPNLLNITLEDLIIEYYENEFIEDEKAKKKFEEELLQAEGKMLSDEDWLKQEMGDEYISPEEKRDNEMEEEEIEESFNIES